MDGPNPGTNATNTCEPIVSISLERSFLPFLLKVFATQSTCASSFHDNFFPFFKKETCPFQKYYGPP